MVLHPVYAQIVDTKIKNIICISSGEYYMAHQCTIASFGEKAITIECSQYAVKPGDFYIDGVFYKADEEDKTKAGAVVKKQYTPDEAAYAAEAKVSAVEEKVADIAINTEYLMMLSDESTDETTDGEDADSSEEASESTSESESEPTSEATSESESTEETATSETAAE